MHDILLQQIQNRLLTRWDAHLPHLLARARNFALGAKRVDAEQAAREAYIAGYRQAYWDGVADVVAAAVQPAPPPTDTH